jgi:hypothetical protein
LGKQSGASCWSAAMCGCISLLCLRLTILPCQVVGDSLMRQLFSRLVHMMRGHSRIIDYKMHTHASYTVCQVPHPLLFSTFCLC